MKQKSRNGSILLSIIFSFVFQLSSFSQVQTARYTAITANSKGFYEFLPQGYSPGGTKFPVIIFFHGYGELGNGASDLPKVLYNGPPKIAAAGGYNASFKFIILSPQFVGWPTNEDVDAIIEYAKSHYEVDISRIYLTGLSMGGAAVWDYAGASLNYAKKLAAILPVCGASYPWIERAKIIAQANLPVWATHNRGDPTIPVWQTEDYITLINSQLPTPIPRAEKTIFEKTGHDAWSDTYSLSFTTNIMSMNVYQWFMTHQSTAAAALPIVLGNYKAFLNATGAVSIQWNTISETNNKNFVVEKSLDGTNFSLLGNVDATNEASGHEYSIADSKPSPGNNFYRLSQVDKDGKTTYFNVLKVIVPLSDNQRFFHLSPNPVVNTILIDLINPVTGALQVSLTDIQGHQLKAWKFQKSSMSWQQSIDVSGIPKGTYIIQVTGNNIREVQRFVKQ